MECLFSVSVIDFAQLAHDSIVVFEMLNKNAL
jgi:hypothetical protein